MPRISEAALQREIMEGRLQAIKEKTGKELQVMHSGSGNYWLAIMTPGKEPGYRQLNGSNYRDKELAAFVAGLHAALCGDEFGK